MVLQACHANKLRPHAKRRFWRLIQVMPGCCRQRTRSLTGSPAQASKAGAQTVRTVRVSQQRRTFCRAAFASASRCSCSQQLRERERSRFSVAWFVLSVVGWDCLLPEPNSATLANAELAMPLLCATLGRLVLVELSNGVHLKQTNAGNRQIKPRLVEPSQPRFSRT